MSFTTINDGGLAVGDFIDGSLDGGNAETTYTVGYDGGSAMSMWPWAPTWSGNPYPYRQHSRVKRPRRIDLKVGVMSDTPQLLSTPDPVAMSGAIAAPMYAAQASGLAWQANIDYPPFTVVTNGGSTFISSARHISLSTFLLDAAWWTPLGVGAGGSIDGGNATAS